MVRQETSLEVRKQILRLHAAEGHSYKDISQILAISRSTVASIVQRYKSTGDILNGARTGRPTVFTDRHRRILKRIVDKDPTLTTRKIAQALKDHHDLEVTRETLRREIHKFGYKALTRRKKPLISKKNRLKRLEFAKENLNKPQEFWNRFLFTDESKFNIFGSQSVEETVGRPGLPIHRENGETQRRWRYGVGVHGCEWGWHNGIYRRNNEPICVY